MATHKFKIGQIVFLSPSFGHNIPAGTYIITKRMPEHHGEFEYQVRSSNEPHERVVRENQLRRAAS